MTTTQLTEDQQTWLSRLQDISKERNLKVEVSNDKTELIFTDLITAEISRVSIDVLG